MVQDNQDTQKNEEHTVQYDPITKKPIPMTNGKPCRVCNDFKTWTKTEKTKTAAKSTPEPTKDDEEWRRNNCPADVATLGRSTWTLLHTMAAYYPEKPAEKDKQSMTSFMESFAQHYPCWFCKDDFQKHMAAEPVQVVSREALSQWLCRRHNEVNIKLNKPVFDCTKVLERWLTGPPDGKCD
ncbi:ERV/ALR sulfhydryl oxidase domain-containing protein [Phycomyces nitens]|nr:ERV/ALR sulfhydryl oxidase domain-containing protein [Phycomyces nitens]